MTCKNQIYWYGEKIKKHMKENGNNYIRNNGTFRKKLEMNKKQLSFALKYLEKTGFLEPWSNKVYQKSNT
jgi:hypothetical protein